MSLMMGRALACEECEREVLSHPVFLVQAVVEQESKGCPKKGSVTLFRYEDAKVARG